MTVSLAQKNGVRPKLHIPTLDLTPFLEDSSSKESEQLIAQVRHAASTSGFFQLTGHGIPKTLQDAVFAGSKALFDLPQDIKESLAPPKGDGKQMQSNRGYELLGNQGLQEGTRPDLKEGYYIGSPTRPSDPVVAKSFLHGANVWPPAALVPESVFRNPMEEYYKALYNLSQTLLRLMASTLPYGPECLQHFAINPVISMRLLHYPPDTSNSAAQFGAGAHSDFGFLTLLLQDEVGGLQVLDPEGKEWHDVEPAKDAYVVNVGDMLSMVTGGAYVSAVHRVINRSGQERYSVPFFFDGTTNAVLARLDGKPVEGQKPLTVEEHMRERFSTSYGRGKKEEAS